MKNIACCLAALASLVVVTAAAGCGDANPADTALYVDVLDDQGNPLAHDDAIRADCTAPGFVGKNMNLRSVDDDPSVPGEATFDCQALEGAGFAPPVADENNAFHFVVHDRDGRFQTLAQTVELARGETRFLSVQLTRAAN